MAREFEPITKRRSDSAIKLAVLKQNGVACLASIQQVDNAAQAIIRQIRSQNPGGKLPSRGALPPPDPRLTQLTAAAG